YRRVLQDVGHVPDGSTFADVNVLVYGDGRVCKKLSLRLFRHRLWSRLAGKCLFTALKYGQHSQAFLSVCSGSFSEPYALEKVLTFRPKWFTSVIWNRPSFRFIRYWHVVLPLNAVRIK